MEPSSLLFFLDAAALLEGSNVEASRCRTTAEVLAEVQPGGATGRRVEHLLAAGLRVEAASGPAQRAVEGAVARSGQAGRLSLADRSILGLAWDHRDEGVLLSDDYTVLDAARRLGIRAEPVTKPGIASTMDWGARCSGCGRRYPMDATTRPCPVCGHEVRARPRRER